MCPGAGRPTRPPASKALRADTWGPPTVPRGRPGALRVILRATVEAAPRLRNTGWRVSGGGVGVTGRQPAQREAMSLPAGWPVPGKGWSGGRSPPRAPQAPPGPPSCPHRLPQRKSRFCTAGTVEPAFWPVTRWRSSTTCTASGSLALKQAPASFTKSSTTRGKRAKPGALTSSYTEGCGARGPAPGQGLRPPRGVGVPR